MRNAAPPLRRAFTLIELLIVVLIIAILAVIALPNLFEAQTRAKISSVRADMRALAAALEAYCADANQYPQALNNGWAKYIVQLSTPVSYIANARIIDPFENRRAPFSQRRHPLFYYGFNESQALNTSQTGRLLLPSIPHGGTLRIHWWMLVSVGPNVERDNLDGTLIAYANLTSGERFIQFLYDPTNGTVSVGEVIRVGGGPCGVSASGIRAAGI